MAAPSPNVEQRGLYISIIVTAGLGAVGVVWGIAVGSQMILLDGVYAVIGIAMSWLWLRGQTGHSDLLRAETAAWRVGSQRLTRDPHRGGRQASRHVRRALSARLDTLPYEIWLNVELTPHRTRTARFL